MKLENLSKAFLKLEFEKNSMVNYIVRCMDVGDEEEFQILEKTSEDVKISNENIPLEIREIVNSKLENCINGFKAYQADGSTNFNEKLLESFLTELGKVSELLKPYITWPELYESNFEAWECLILEDYDGLEELEEDEE